MASAACRSAAAMRCFAARSTPNTLLRNLASKPTILTSPLPCSSSTRPLPLAASRVASVLGSVESMMPLHSAIASARLRSSIAVDSTCWSWLSRGLAIPL